METESTRQHKVSRLIQKELGNIFQQESRSLFEGRMISVTQVRVSPDLGLAKVYISVFPKKEDNPLNLINVHTKALRMALGTRVRHQLRKVPEIVFYIDDSLDYIERIDQLLKP